MDKNDKMSRLMEIIEDIQKLYPKLDRLIITDAENPDSIIITSQENLDDISSVTGFDIEEMASTFSESDLESDLADLFNFYDLDDDDNDEGPLQ